MMPKSIGDDAPLGVDEEIALMHVGVEEAVAQRVAQERLDQRPAELGRVEAEFGEARGIAERRPVDPFHRQRFAGRAVPIDLRRAEPGIVGEVLGELGSRRRFEAEVHLDRTLRASVSTTSTRRSRRSLGSKRSALRAAKNMSERSRAKRRSTPGRNSLTATSRSPLASRTRASMHLGDRSGGDRARRIRRTASRSARRTRLRARRRRRRGRPAPCGPAASPARSPTLAPTMSGRVARNWPSLT